jgi:hypothetical protein
MLRITLLFIPSHQGRGEKRLIPLKECPLDSQDEVVIFRYAK